MHDRGVIHRDLKPGNIMICCDGTLRLMDFGIASDAAARRITLSGFTSAIGTPDYMAPEQVRNTATDERTDIYTLGAVLYEMLTGSTPFPNDNPWVTMNNRVHGDPPAPRKLNPLLSPQAEEIVLHAMQRDPADRYQSVAEMKADLDARTRCASPAIATASSRRVGGWAFAKHRSSPAPSSRSHLFPFRCCCSCS